MFKSTKNHIVYGSRTSVGSYERPLGELGKAHLLWKQMG